MQVAKWRSYTRDDAYFNEKPIKERNNYVIVRGIHASASDKKWILDTFILDCTDEQWLSKTWYWTKKDGRIDRRYKRYLTWDKASLFVKTRHADTIIRL